MRTNVIMTMAMAALLAAGCAQNEITEISPDASPAVGFRIFTDAQGRGTITDNNTGTTGLKTKGFGVFAYYTGQKTWAAEGANLLPNFMFNQQVTFASNVWTYSPIKYWPNTEDDKISFFAYSPYSTATAVNGIDLIANSSTKGAPTMYFGLQNLPEEMVDLVATDGTQNSGANNTIDIVKQTSTVSFLFKHVLTRASFKAKLDASLTTTAETHVFITGMRILGTADSGTGGNTSGANASSKFYNGAIYQWGNGTWKYTEQPRPSAYALNSVMPLKAQSGIGSQYTTQGIELPQSATEVQLFNSNQYLFLIPPADITGITAATDVRMQLDYDIVTVDSKIPTTGYSITSTSATVSLPNGTLKRGSAYLYTFTIGLEKVQVSASVQDWAGDTNVAVPSADAASATAAAINAAIVTLNQCKTVNANCNYFVVNVTGAPTTATTLSAIANDKFVSGDRIELKCSTTPSSTYYTLGGWTATKSGSSVILTKN